MNRGAHLLATGMAGVIGRFVREIMLALEEINVGCFYTFLRIKKNSKELKET